MTLLSPRSLLAEAHHTEPHPARGTQLFATRGPSSLEGLSRLQPSCGLLCKTLRRQLVLKDG